MVRGAAPAPSLWDRVGVSWQHGLAVLVLVVVATAFFAPVTIGSYTLMGGDIVQWRGMAQAMLDFEAETGTRALWAPNGFSGMPGYHIHYPREVLQIDDLPRWLRALGLWPWAHFMVLLLGVYALVFYLFEDVLASLLGAIAFGFTTYIPIILAAGHNTKFIALAFAPWLVLSFFYLLRQPAGAGWSRTAIGTLLFAVACAVNLRADHVQITYYVVMALGVVWLVHGVVALREGALKSFAVSSAALVAGGLLGLLMVAHPYMAVAEYKAYTVRGAGGNGLGWQHAMMWSQGIGELVTLLIPNAYGSSGATYWGPKPFTKGPHYVGPLVLLLAVLALVGVKRVVVYALGIAAALMVLLSLGEHFPLLSRLMFEYFPFYNAFRVPETWLAIVALVLAVLAGAGLYFLARREPTPEGEARKTRATYISLAALGGLLVLLLIGRDALFAFEAPGELERITAAAAAHFDIPEDDPRAREAARHFIEQMKAERREMFTSDALMALLFFGLGAVLIVLQRRRLIPGWALQVGLVLLVLVDLWRVDRRYFHVDHPAVMTPAQVQRAIPEFGFDRFVRAQVQVAGGSGHFRTFPLALNPFNDGRTPFFYESIGGYHGAKLALYQDYIDYLVVGPDGGLNPVGLDLTATRFVISRGPLPGMEVAFEDPETGLLVLERPEALPRAWFVERVEVLPSDEEVLRRLRHAEVDLRTTALMVQPPAALPAGAAPGEARVELVRFTPREILWQVETDAPRLFVASEVYFPAGWRARAGGQELPIYRVNHLLRGVVVPEGSHILEMRFTPEVHRKSILVAWIATALVYLTLLALIGLAWYRRGASA